MSRGGLLFVAILVGTIATTAFPAPKRPTADASVHYGPSPQQLSLVWLPKGPGPFPVVILVHGGCWMSGGNTLAMMAPAAADLRARGFAVWDIDYRGIDDPGGGYPGTFQDVAAAIDSLAPNAARFHLDTHRVAIVGHSAGGQLALWAAARDHLPAASPLARPRPLPITAAIGLGAPPDLQANVEHPSTPCMAGAMPRLLGQPTPARPDVYADTSAAALPPPTAPITLISGTDDTMVPPYVAEAFAARMQGAGKPVTRITAPATDHLQLVKPDSSGWHAAVTAIEKALKPKP